MNEEVIAVQVCALQSPPPSLVISTISDGSHGVGSSLSTRFEIKGGSALAEAWQSHSRDGHAVASRQHTAGEFDALVVGNYYFKPPSTMPIGHWTKWVGPNAVVAEQNASVFEMKLAQGRDAKSTLIDSTAPFPYVVRYRQMAFKEYLGNMPQYQGPSEAWTTDQIPNCEQN